MGIAAAWMLGGFVGSSWGCAAKPRTLRPSPPSGPWRGGVLPAPDLSDAAVLRYDAGIRPYRRGSVRLAVSQPGELTPGQRWVHNYGHGGSGWTLSWGCADWAASRLADEWELERDRPADDPTPHGAAVLGGGIIGLTTAAMLARRGISVTVYAERFDLGTTSAKAGAQFAPSLVTWGDDAPISLQTVLRVTHREYRRDASVPAAGVHAKTNFTAERGGGALRGVPDDLSRPRGLDRLPFAEVQTAGRAYDTLHLEPPKYLALLRLRLETRGVRFETRRFDSPADVASLPQRRIANCLGLGAGSLLSDDAVIPIRGQLVHLRPQPELTYMISHRGYMFPRSDAVVLGGTIERGVTDATPDDRMCRAILNRHRAFWGWPQDTVASPQRSRMM